MKLTLTYKKTEELVWKLFLGSIFFCLYGVLFYLILSSQHIVDFSSFYSSSQTAAIGGNPYQVLLTDYLPIAEKIPANLNPPTVLWLMSPLTYLDYYSAMAIWSILSLMSGLIGAGIAFHYAFSPAFMKKNGFYLYLIYLSFFSTLMNTALAQLGSLLLFLTMSGYHFFMKHRDYSAGVLWGALVAIKFFPALLLVYAVVQKRYKVSMVMVCTFVVLSLIPLFVYGTSIYTQYFSMMPKVMWYGKSWNASILGMLFRAFVDVTNTAQNLQLVKFLYASLFSIAFVLYLLKMIKIEKSKDIHQSFCLTIVVMLLLSPFGWMYYFSLLAFPLAFTWTAIVHKASASLIKSIWCLCIIFINFPINNIALTMMGSTIEKLSIFSLDFYGLLLLLYLLFCERSRFIAKPDFSCLNFLDKNNLPNKKQHQSAQTGEI